MIEIAPAKIEDIPTITRLVMLVIEQLDLAVVKTIGTANFEKLLQESAVDPDYRYSYARALVAYENSQIIAVAFYYPNEDEPKSNDAMDQLLLQKFNLAEKSFPFPEGETYGSELYLDTIVVDPKFRGRGIGTKLIQQLPDIARKFGKKIVGLAVDDRNPKAKKLYQKIGFKEVHHAKWGKDYYTDMHWKF